MNNKIGIRRWLMFILAGFVGQLAWAIENNYFNVYVYDCTSEYAFIPVMTACSAAAATITTLLMGAVSDRLGKRKLLISVGYILWGISILFFAFLNPHSSFNIIANNVFLAGTMIVIMDCVMTFFGSTANDAAFNAFVTDNTTENNRSRVESVLSILPLIALIAVIVVAGVFVPDTGSEKRWDLFFYIFGGITLLIGIVSFFLTPKDVITPNKEEPYFKNIFYGFRPSVIKANPILYITLIAFMVFNIGLQVFMPYFILYVKNILGIIDDDFTVSLGVVLLTASAITVIFGLFMDKIGKNKIMIPALIVGAIGGIVIFFIPANTGAGTQIGLIIGGIILMAGYLISTAVLGAKVRDYTPAKEVGLFQGVRMIFCVLIPMILGPMVIAEIICRLGGDPYKNEYGVTVYPPNKWLFFVTGIIFALAIIPVIIMIRKEKKINETKSDSAE